MAGTRSKTRFLDHLAAKGNVRAACGAVGMTREAAYALRRRDALFARGWAAALVLARENSVEVLADKATEGIEEDVWYRGELVGTRRRFDARLLLAHLARLDRLVEEAEGAVAGAARFEEILACVAGVEVPEELRIDEEALPLDRESAIAKAGDDAADAVDAAWEEREAAAENGLFSDEDYAAYRHECRTAAATARAEAGARWDGWFTSACAVVEEALARATGIEAHGADSSLRTVSEVPSSAAVATGGGA